MQDQALAAALAAAKAEAGHAAKAAGLTLGEIAGVAVRTVGAASEACSVVPQGPKSATAADVTVTVEIEVTYGFH